MLEKFLNKATLGDSYELIKQIPDKSIDLIHTDPPYLHDNHGGGGMFGSRERAYHDEISFISKGYDLRILDEFIRVMKKINMYIWCNKNQVRDILNKFIDCNIDILTWHKTNPTPTCNNKYLSDTEYCIYIREKGVAVNGDYGSKKKFWVTSTNKYDKAIFEHSTIKPLQIIKDLISNSSKKGDIIADFFGGSGTTGEACIELNRQFILIENNPKWHKVSEDRLKGITASGQYSIFGNSGA